MTWAIDSVHRSGMVVSLQDDHVRLEMAVCDGDPDEPDLAFCVAALAHLLPRDVGTALLERGRLLRASRYRMHSRFASSFQALDDRVLLLGDAAHVIEPFTGQGVSNGFADVEYVTERLCRGETLRHYTRDRVADLRPRHWKATAFGYLLHIKSPTLIRVAQLLFDYVIPQAFIDWVVLFMMS